VYTEKQVVGTETCAPFDATCVKEPTKYKKPDETLELALITTVSTPASLVGSQTRPISNRIGALESTCSQRRDIHSNVHHLKRNVRFMISCMRHAIKCVTIFRSLLPVTDSRMEHRGALDKEVS
jgi:hypothetical protein